MGVRRELLITNCLPIGTERMFRKRANPKKVLMVGPMPTNGNYIGGIAVILSQILDRWSLPFEVITYNTNTVARDYASTNRLNWANVSKLLRNAKDLIAILRRERPGIVHFHTSRHRALLKDLLLVVIIRTFCRCKVIGHIHHASYPTFFVGKSERCRSLQIRALMVAFDRILLMSDSIRKDLATRLTAPSRRKFLSQAEVLYNFVPIPESDIHRAPNASAIPTLFFIGNVGRQKGVFELLNCAGALKRSGMRFNLVLAGPFDSPMEGEKIKNLISSHDLSESVKTIGPVSGPEKAGLFEAADIFVLPSYAEGVPLSMLEAMSYGLPVVVTAVGGIPEILADGKAGFLVAPGDSDGLKLAVRNLILAPVLRLTMGEAGREQIKKSHCPEIFLRRLGAIYEELTDSLTDPATAHLRDQCHAARS